MEEIHHGCHMEVVSIEKSTCLGNLCKRKVTECKPIKPNEKS